MAGQMPPDIREILENVGNQRSGAAGLVGTIVLRMMLFFVFLFISAIFSTLGGLLGAAVFAKRLPPGTIDVPPSTPL
jgi:hypothetical protein